MCSILLTMISTALSQLQQVVTAEFQENVSVALDTLEAPVKLVRTEAPSE